MNGVLLVGKCFRLYMENTPLPAENVPHILESDITSTVLFLKRMEIAGLGHCDFIDRPGETLINMLHLQARNPMMHSYIKNRFQHLYSSAVAFMIFDLLLW